MLKSPFGPIKFITLGLIPIPVSFLYTHAHMPKAPRTRTQPARRAKKPASKKQQTSKKQKTAKQATKKRKPTKQQQLTSLNERIRDVLGNIRLVSNISEPLPPPQDSRPQRTLYLLRMHRTRNPQTSTTSLLSLCVVLLRQRNIYIVLPRIPFVVRTTA
ncbi:hypothetical protein PM082_019732 [Marasmius tenuissimus]|nr:hypothetical protein PM082_019732 [Marasmius tenuissimus]